MLPNSKPRRWRNLNEPGQLVSREHFICVSTMEALFQTEIKVNDMKILDTEIIFARAMVLLCTQRNYDTNKLMAHELAHRPASICDFNHGDVL